MAQVMDQSAPSKQTSNSRPVGPTGLAGIRSGVVLRGCECNKRNGLSHDCRCGLKHVQNPVSQGQGQNQPCPPADRKNAAGDQIYCQQPAVTTYQHAQGDGTGNVQMQAMQNQAQMGNNPHYANFDPNSYHGQGNPNQQVVCDPALLNQQQNTHYTNQVQGGYAQSNLPMQTSHVHNHPANTIAGMPNSTPLLNQNSQPSNEIRPCEHMMTAGQTNVCAPNLVQNNQAANMQMQHTCGAHPNSMVCAQNTQNHMHNVAEILEQVPNQHASHHFAQGNYNVANAMTEQPCPVAHNQSTFPNCPHQHNQLQNQNTYLASPNSHPGQMYQQNTAAQEQVNVVHQNAQLNSTNQSQIQQHMHTGYENQYTPCEHHHPQGAMPQAAMQQGAMPQAAMQQGAMPQATMQQAAMQQAAMQQPSAVANNTQAMSYSQNTMAQFPNNNQYYQNQQGIQGNTGYLNAQQGHLSPNQQQITNSSGFQNYQGHQHQQTNAVANNMQQGHFGMGNPGYSNAVAPTV